MQVLQIFSKRTEELVGMVTQNTQSFDVFESEKLGKDKKSIAVNFVFLDEEKTLTDTEIEGWMKKIMQTLEKDLQVEIRK